MPEKLVVPMCNINGNRKEELVEQLTNASDKLMGALLALQQTEWFNARNFQTHPDTKAALEAREQHRAWVLAVSNVQVQVMQLAIAIDEQGR